MTKHDGILLVGLDGSNPLAFLAALGTLRTLSQRRSKNAAIKWEISEGKWTPRIVNCDIAADDLPNALCELLAAKLDTPWNADKRLPFAASRLRDMAVNLIAEPTRNDDAIAVVAALGCEVFTDEKGHFEDTAFRMVRSGDAAGQGFLDYACKIAALTTAEDLNRCLFGRWKYQRCPSLRWDPAENREYALQAGNPSDDGALSEIGATRLAIEALALFTTHPGNNGLSTTGFWQPRPRSNLEFRWPIWSVAISLEVIRSVLVNPNLFGESLDPKRLIAKGIQTVFASRQIRPNQYYRNFSPAISLI